MRLLCLFGVVIMSTFANPPLILTSVPVLLRFGDKWSQTKEVWNRTVVGLDQKELSFHSFLPTEEGRSDVKWHLEQSLRFHCST
jgi:hypothetical protein